jgi:hypothetical protein
MNYPGDDGETQMMGLGSYIGELRQGSDGSLYQWTQGIDGLGNPVGFWKKLRRGLRQVARRALPIASRLAPLVPGGAAVAAGLTKVTPYLQQAGVAGYDGLGATGLGALYEAPDGTLYQQIEGLAEDEDLQGLGDADVTQMMGLGSYIGEMRQGPDGSLYQWTQGIDGLGNPVGFWKKLRRGLKRIVKKALPIVSSVAPLIPIPGVGPAITAGLKTITPLLRQAGVAGYEGLGALYQAPDGTLYQQVTGDPMQGQSMEGYPMQGQPMQGYPMQGYQGYEDGEMAGLAEGSLQEYGNDDAFQGYADDEMAGYAEDEDLQGMEGYVRQDGMNGVDAYVPQEPPKTQWYSTPAQTPEMWKSPW